MNHYNCSLLLQHLLASTGHCPTRPSTVMAVSSLGTWGGVAGGRGVLWEGAAEGDHYDKNNKYQT